jgi:hypothetical protein
MQEAVSRARLQWYLLVPIVIDHDVFFAPLQKYEILMCPAHESAFADTEPKGYGLPGEELT